MLNTNLSLRKNTIGKSEYHDELDAFIISLALRIYASYVTSLQGSYGT